MEFFEHTNSFICDFCGFEVSIVRRVVLDGDYDRMMNKALYACVDCSEQKEKERLDNV